MSFSDLYGSGRHVRNVAHFSSLVNLASIDGEIKPEREVVLKRLAKKLGVSREEYAIAVANPSEFPVHPSNQYKRRLERLHEILTVIFAGNTAMTEEEETLLKKYAVAIGFNSKDSKELIDKSVRILSGKLNFDEFIYVLEME